MRQVIFGHASGNLPGTGFNPINFVDQSSSFDAAKWKLIAAGTFRNLRIRLNAAPGAGTSWTCTLYKNGVATSLSVVISDSDTEGSDETNSVAVVEGDTVAFQWLRTGAATLTLASTSVQFDSTTTGEVIASNKPGRTDTTARFNSVFNGIGSWQTFFQFVRNIIPQAMTLTRLDVELTVAGAPGTPAPPGIGDHKIYAIYKNGVRQDGTGGTVDTVVDITGDVDSTGTKSFSLPLVRGDYIYIEVTLSGTPTSSDAKYSTKVICDSNKKFPINAVYDNQGSAVNYFTPSATFIDDEDATEANIVTVGTTKNLRVGDAICVMEAPGAGDTRTFDVRVNSASPAGTPTLTLSDAETTDEDNVNTALIGKTDVWNWRTSFTGTPASANPSVALTGEVLGGGKGASNKGRHGGGVSVVGQGGANLLSVGNPGLNTEVLT